MKLGVSSNLVVFFPQLRVRLKVRPEGCSQEAVPALPVHHPRQTHIQRTAAAETHETRECKRDVLPALLQLFFSTFIYSMNPLLTGLCLLYY